MTVTKFQVGLAMGAWLALPAAGMAADAKAAVTFSKDVAPIFQAKCVSCHEPDSIAPMSLRTYEDSRPWARSIKQRVSTRQMPPWHINQAVGVQRFQNDMSLSDAQIETVVAWVDQGAPQGNPADLPALKPVTTALYWQAERDGHGPPDLVVKSPEYTMPAVSQDQWWRPLSDIPVTEARWIRMIEIRPTNLEGRKILHHSVAYQVLNPNNAEAVNPGLAQGTSANTGAADLVNRRPMLMEWAIGKGYDRYMEGTGKVIMPGEKISWDNHIHAAGEPITAGAELGIWLYPKGQEPKKRTVLIPFSGLKGGPGSLDIPPNSVAHTEGFNILRENTLITNFQPHFHLRGKAMQVEAILPDGTTQVISYTDNFNFNWMTNYIFAEDAIPAFPKGTVIHVTAWYDNTANNKFNPDPNQWVGYGDRTVDEMAHAWMNVVYLTDQEYQDWLAKHGGRPGVQSARNVRAQREER
jgi:mono/diheme cytochrome c family protein